MPDTKTSTDEATIENGAEEEPELSSCCWGPFKNRYRYAVLILAVACLTSTYSNVIALNFTFICMTPPANASDPKAFIAPKGVPLHDYTQYDKSLFQWAVAGGSAVGTFPFTYAYQRLGARWVFMVSGVLSAVSTLLIPVLASLGKWYVFAVRILLGIAYSSNFAVIGHIVIRWATAKEVGFFLGLLTAFTSMSSAISNPISGLLCESAKGWPVVFYLYGAVGLLLFGLWTVFYSDNPHNHFAVSGQEIQKIHKDKSETQKYGSKTVPYLKILTNRYVIVIWINALADIGCIVFLSTYAPTYLNKVLNYSVEHTGFIGALPAILQVTAKLITGFLSDRFTCISERWKLIIFNSLSLFVAGILYGSLGFVPDDQQILAMVVFVAIHVFLSANCGGFYKAATLVGKQYTAFIVSCIQFIKCLTLFLGPALVWIFVKDESSKSQWRIVFLILAGTLIVANFLFCVFSTTKPGTFTIDKVAEADEDDEENEDDKKNKKEKDAKKKGDKSDSKKDSKKKEVKKDSSEKDKSEKDKSEKDKSEKSENDQSKKETSKKEVSKNENSTKENSKKETKNTTKKEEAKDSKKESKSKNSKSAEESE